PLLGTTSLDLRLTFPVGSRAVGVVGFTPLFKFFPASVHAGSIDHTKSPGDSPHAYALQTDPAGQPLYTMCTAVRSQHSNGTVPVDYTGVLRPVWWCIRNG
ncbi:unnamed protein product, partial [Ectocarpus sp. 12 AP-2014]